MIPEFFIYLTIPLGLVGVFFYIREMSRGTVRPNRVSFLLWSLAPLIGTVISFRHGAGISILPVFMAGFNPLVIFIYSFIIKNGYWKLTALDYVCGALALCALIFWLLINTPTLALTFAILSDLFAGIPTIVKSWKEPSSESPQLYLLGIINNIIGLLVLSHWTYLSASFGIYLIVLNITIIATLYRPHK